MSTGIYDQKKAKAITIHTLLLVNNCIQNSGEQGKINNCSEKRQPRAHAEGVARNNLHHVSLRLLVVTH